MYAVEKLPIDGDLFFFQLKTSLCRRPEWKTDILLMFSSNFLFFQSHADIEVVSLVLFFDQSHPFIYLLFLQFYLADVGLIPVQSMHR